MIEEESDEVELRPGPSFKRPVVDEETVSPGSTMVAMTFERKSEMQLVVTCTSTIALARLSLSLTACQTAWKQGHDIDCIDRGVLCRFRGRRTRLEHFAQDVLHLVELTSKWRLLRSSFLACCLLYILARLDARSSAALAHRDQNHFARRETRPPILQTPAHRHAEEHLLEYVARRRTVYSADAFDAQSDPARLISAVLLHTDRPRSVALVLRSIVLHPFIKEVIVWNNGPADLDYAVRLHPPCSGEELELDEQTFAPMLAETNARLRIVNAPASLGDAARYHACTMARYPTCYFASDRWLNPYLDTLYTLYQDIDGDVSGTVIGAVPVDATWQAHRLRFSNPGASTSLAAPPGLRQSTDLALHAGFALVETGSLASRDLARRFLAQQTVESMGLSRANALACDSYFGLWTNAYPIEVRFVPSCHDYGVELDRRYPASYSRSTSKASPSRRTTLMPLIKRAWCAPSPSCSQISAEKNQLDAIRKLYDVLRLINPRIVPSLFTTSLVQLDADVRSVGRPDLPHRVDNRTGHPAPTIDASLRPHSRPLMIRPRPHPPLELERAQRLKIAHGPWPTPKKAATPLPKTPTPSSIPLPFARSPIIHLRRTFRRSPGGERRAAGIMRSMERYRAYRDRLDR